MLMGISITEDYIYICTDDNKEVTSIPFVILRNTENNSWHIGGKAFELSLLNKGIIIDKLLYMIQNNSHITVSSSMYTAQNLLDYYFKELLLQYETPEYVTISLQNNDIKILQAINYSFSSILENNKFYITSNSETLISYALSKTNEYLDDTVGLIDFTNKSLTYYELNKKITKNNKNVYEVKTTNHPPISKDMLKDKTGELICNNLLTEFLKEVAKDKKYSLILISGVGLENYEKYIDFINLTIKVSSHVVQETHIFAYGALCMSYNKVNNIIDNSYYITDMRTKNIIRLLVDNIDKNHINICNFGEEWFYKDDIFNILIDNQMELTFKIYDYNKNHIKDIVHKLNDDLKLRDNKTNMLSLHFKFTEQNIFEIDITDEGFGEFYERTGITSICEGTL